ncbi:MAG TPA: M28 family peptidase [Bryobacteraceae bacterium]|nr:M28 family peptidase [Bryobacteraceae bacterium]
MRASRAGWLCLLSILPASCVTAESISFYPVPKEVVLARLRQAASRNHDREATLKKLFGDAGCPAEWIAEQPVKHLKIPNVMCTWPGSTGARILVSAHTDHVETGDGTVDDWSGAAMLADLIESLRSVPRRHTFVFIGFSGEEQGLVGSAFYVKQLTPEQRSTIAAEVNLECLGLSHTEVWSGHADRQLANLAAVIAAAAKLPVHGVNLEEVYQDDAVSFAERRIPTIPFHSLTQETLAVLHSPHDTIHAIHPDYYYESYRLLAYYLAFIDQRLDAKPDTAVR